MILENTIQQYAWGSRTAIPDLLGIENSGNKPCAELWMGTHPKAPSKVRTGEESISLGRLIENNPLEMLGRHTCETFGGTLPFLFKILAAESPLSIQAHPNIEQAREGFARENSLGIPVDAPERNYRDDNHKPEILCALTNFHALRGFREISGIIGLLETLALPEIETEIHALKSCPDSRGLADFFRNLMTSSSEKKAGLAKSAAESAEKHKFRDTAFEWICRLNEKYPGDTGVLAPAFLNVVVLKPGQAMYLPAGELHAYLYGTGIELMANSDNVLRGGLTSKHVDVDELMRILEFSSGPVEILEMEQVRPGEQAYTTQASEFLLSKLTPSQETPYSAPETHSAEILICISGEARLTYPGTGFDAVMGKGESVFIPAETKNYKIKGDAQIYRASTPV